MILELKGWTYHIVIITYYIFFWYQSSKNEHAYFFLFVIFIILKYYVTTRSYFFFITFQCYFNKENVVQNDFDTYPSILYLYPKIIRHAWIMKFLKKQILVWTQTRKPLSEFQWMIYYVSRDKRLLYLLSYLNYL